MENLAPNIYRQRLIIEGTSGVVHPKRMTEYLAELSKKLNMEVVKDPEISFCEEHGYVAYMHWTTSGAYMYTWINTVPMFFSIEIYTCKPFLVEEAVLFTKQFFEKEIIKLVWKEV